MATVDKQIQESLDNFIELDRLLFDEGEIIPYEVLFEKAESGEPFTVREAYTMRLYAEGIAITPQMEKNPQTKARARVMLDTFGRAGGQPATIGGHRSQLESLVSRGVSLDSSFDDFYRESRATKAFSGIAKNINALNTAVEKFKKGSLAPKAAGESRKLKRVPTKATISAIVEGIGRIPDPELRDAVFISVFGMRGAQLADIAVDAEIATGTESVRPYFDPDSGVLVSPEPHYKTRKPLPPSKTMGPIATQILQRRHAAAVEAGESRLFPNVESKDISNALKRYVFNPEYFPQKEIDHLGKKPSGITDLRKIFVSYTVKELGDAKLADELLGHPDNANNSVVEEAVSKVGAKFYLTTEATGPEAYGNLLTRFEQDMGRAADKSSFTTLAESMRIEVPQDVSIEFVDFDAPTGFASTDEAGQYVPNTIERTPEQIAQAQRTAEAIDYKNEQLALKEAEEAALKREEARKARLAAKGEADELADAQPTKSERTQARTVKRFTEISDKVGAALQGFFDDMDFKSMGGLGLGLGVVGGAMTYSGATEAFEEEGADPTTAKALGAAQATYETLETPPMMVARAALHVGKAGGPEAVLGETEEQRAYAEQMGGIETEFSRAQAIKEFDRQQAVIAEQQGRIAEYDAKMASQQGSNTDRQMNQLLRNISGE